MAKLLVILALLGSTYSATLEATPCTVHRYSDVANAARNCDNLIIKDIVIPAKTTLKIDLKNHANLVFDGRLTHEVAEWTGDLIQISGTKANVSGTSNNIIDGLGAQYWKGALRPNVLKLKLVNSVVLALNFKNCPNNCLVIQSDNTYFSDINIDNHDLNYAENNVGFDISTSTNLNVENSVIINQGDCVAITGGTNLIFENLDCQGSGLRVSNKEEEAINIKFLNSKISNAKDAIHIRAYNDASSGSIRNILYQNIRLTGISSCAVDVQQNNPNDITSLTLENVRGSLTGSKSQAINIICSSGGCIGFVFKDVIVSGARQENICQNVPGISC